MKRNHYFLVPVQAVVALAQASTASEPNRNLALCEMTGFESAETQKNSEVRI